VHGQLAEYLCRHEQELFRFLRDLVLEQSFSRNKDGVDRVGRLIVRELAELPMSCSRIEQSELGDHLLFRSPACGAGRRPILLVGHMDTVFPPESGFDGYREEEGRVFGPGVIDMKGGIAAAVFALKALHHCGLLEEIPLTLICNSDEEIGSPTSTGIIRREAKESLFGLVFECGGLNGEAVTGRKGKTGYALEVGGRAGHAAFAGAAKASAILELAHKIIAVERLNDPDRQLVVNVGMVSGGIGPNTVPEQAAAQIDIRYLTVADGQDCDRALRRIAADCRTPGTRATLTVLSGRPPMEQSVANSRLFDCIRRQAETLGLPFSAELRSGVSDANTIAAAGIPVVDGLGPLGDCDHSRDEYMLRESLPQRTRRAAAAIAGCWMSHCRQFS